jgi:hypothetical protein
MAVEQILVIMWLVVELTVHGHFERAWRLLVVKKVFNTSADRERIK